MEQVHKERLLKLYKHVIQPQERLAHKKFNFLFYNGNLGQLGASHLGNRCGTIGCMAGEMPAVFPGEIEWEDNGIVGVETNRHDICLLKDFFGLPYREIIHLFSPGCQSEHIDPYFDGRELIDSFATKEEVTENLRRFLKIKGILDGDDLDT